MSTRMLVLRVAGVFVALTAWLLVPSGSAHQDEEGYEIDVAVTGLDVTVLKGNSAAYNLDDGFNFETELNLTVALNHDGHGEGFTANMASSGLRTTFLPSVWDLSRNENFEYDHRECSPRNVVTIGTTLVELDSKLTDQVMGELGEIAAEAAAGYLVGGPIGAAAGVLAGRAVTAISLLNGNDDIGAASGLIPSSGVIPENSILTLHSRGSDGSADIRIQGRTAYKGSGPYFECSPALSAAAPLPTERTSKLFRPLTSALQQIPLVQAEAGNPSRLSSTQLADIRATLTRGALGIAELLTGAEIQDARTYQGVQVAIDEFRNAQELAAGGDAISAARAYEAAFYQAAAARYTALRGAESLLPFQTSVTPDFFSTKPGRTVSVVVSILGARNPANLQVLNVPHGAQVIVERPDPSLPVFVVALKLDDILPGTYSIAFRANDGSRTTSKDMVLIVNAVACDIDANGVVNRDDITAIHKASSVKKPASDDRRDADADGQITAADARVCSLKCTDPKCRD